MDQSREERSDIGEYRPFSECGRRCGIDRIGAAILIRPYSDLAFVFSFRLSAFSFMNTFNLGSNSDDDGYSHSRLTHYPILNYCFHFVKQRINLRTGEFSLQTRDFV